MSSPDVLALEARRKRIEARYGSGLAKAKRHHDTAERLLANRARNFQEGTRGWDAISKSIDRELKLAARALGQSVKVTAAIERSCVGGTCKLK